MKRRRRYTLRARAASQAETRLRIVEAAVALHREVGPARTTFSEIADRAGVQRHTVYRHFPTGLDILRACREQFMATHPFPDPTGWRELPAGPERLRAGLAALYGYYAANREMVGNVLRDSDLLPVGRGFRDAGARIADSLADGWPAAKGRAVRVALALATDFFTWRTLADGPRLAPSEAADLMSRMVDGARLARPVGRTSSARRAPAARRRRSEARRERPRRDGRGAFARGERDTADDVSM